VSTINGSKSEPIRIVHAIFENGVFRPIERVNLPEGSEVEFEPRVVATPRPGGPRARIHALLSRRIETGEDDLAETHDEPAR
jgi:predicted DNA-binding antitoxin AbrB/MazE fold protein